MEAVNMKILGRILCKIAIAFIGKNFGAIFRYFEPLKTITLHSGIIRNFAGMKTYDLLCGKERRKTMAKFRMKMAFGR